MKNIFELLYTYKSLKSYDKDTIITSIKLGMYIGLIITIILFTILDLTL